MTEHYTINGEPITDELIERYVAEAEAGYHVDKLRELTPEESARLNQALGRDRPA